MSQLRVVCDDSKNATCVVLYELKVPALMNDRELQVVEKDFS